MGGTMQDVYAQVAGMTSMMTLIEGQIYQEDFQKMVQELCCIAAQYPTRIGGNTLGHIGLILEDADYQARSQGGAAFVKPAHPGACPTNLSDNAREREIEMAEHKLLREEYETAMGVEMGLKELIVKTVPKEHLVSITDKMTGLTNQTIQQILAHLSVEGAELDDNDVADLINKMNEPWAINEAPATYFQRQDEIEEQLLKGGIARNPVLRLRSIKAAVKQTGEYDIELNNWELKPIADQTFVNFRPYFQKEWVRKNHKNRTNTKAVSFGIANNAQSQETPPQQSEQELLSEFMALMQSESDKKIEKFMSETNATLTATTKALEAIASKVGGSNNNRNRNRNTNGGGGGKERKKCPHCDKYHYDLDTCWELEKNKDKRPANWKSVKENSS